MQLSIHYYVLSLSEQTIRLFEGFRDTLIEINNGRFPFENVHPVGSTKSSQFNTEQLRGFFSESDEHLTHYYDQEPLWVIVTGEQAHISLFERLTIHEDSLIGHLVGNYAGVSSRDVGRIVWMVMKKILAGTNSRAIHDLDAASASGRLIAGLDAVATSLESDVVYSLFLEEDYQVAKRRIRPESIASLLRRADINEAIDDPVDIQVERVLSRGGEVVFLESDFMIKYQRIALVTPLHSAGPVLDVG